jgi:hypothetical protein
MIDFTAAERAKLLPLRAQADLRNAWLRERLDTLLPDLMERTGLDAWIVDAREYNEDPVIMTLLPEPSMAARRRAILLFHRCADGSVERLTLDRYGYADFYARGWDPDTGEDQYACLARLLRERNPQRIGINTSEDFAFGDGLTYTEYGQLAAALGGDLMARTSTAERLVIGWLERRIPAEIDHYPAMIALGHRIIAEAFSDRVIIPGSTTTDDLAWWMRQTMHDLGLRAWFQPTIEIQAAGQRYDQKDDVRTLIQPGDLLHCDMGFYYLGLATDQQQNAYILRPGEHDAPAGIKAALAAGNQLQDIHMAALQVGRSGNEVLAAALAEAADRDINATIYSHPLGYHGHAAGPTIGLWDQQGGVPGRGDYPVFDRTCYSIELNARAAVPEWDGQEVRMALEEDALLWDDTSRWLDGRQTELHLIRSAIED